MTIKGQGAILAVSTATAAAKVITGITDALAPVVSSAAHGFVNGNIVLVDSVAGMTELNARAFVVDTSLSGSFTLKGEDASLYTPYVSGGTAALQTMTPISNATNVQGFDGQSTEIDVTHLQSSAKEFQLGLEDFGSATLTVFLVTDAGQARLRALKSSATKAPFSLTLADGSIAAFMAFVKQFSFSGVKPDGAVDGQVTLRITGRPAWFA